MENIIKLLPGKITNQIKALPSQVLSAITEIRLRAGKPVALTVGNEVRFIDPLGISILPSAFCAVISSDELSECFYKLCDNSVYTHESELQNGYLNLKNGCRAGVCGTYFKREDGSFSIREISSISLRIAREVKGSARAVYAEKLNGGILICGAPHTGKTTLLRDYVRLISDGGERVSLIDSRGELAAVKNGEPTLDVGINTDVISGGTKSLCIENALRALAPQTIAFDEIGSKEELEGIVDCFNAGVRMITTIHSSNESELIRRNEKLPILESGAFKNIIFLDKSFKHKIIKAEDFFDEVVRSNSHSYFGFDYRVCRSDEASEKGKRAAVF